MDTEKAKKQIDKINNVKGTLAGNHSKTDDIIKLKNINKTLLEIIEDELKTKKVPSKELLDTLQATVIITAALNF